MDDVPLDDPAVYDMLARGGTTGVFQFESSLATDKLRAMRCDRFEDLVATNALIRPGPLDSGMTDVYIRRKTGREPVRYPHPLLEDVLAPTYGVITYQEQVMRMAQVLAGFTLAEADVLRKAVGKKDMLLIQKEVGRFVERAKANGVEQRIADEIADQVTTFGRYGFNRSHSVAYALLSYQTAWLKRHYPAEFMAALLSSVVDRTDDVVGYIAECRELGRYVPDRPRGVTVLPPDVNESGWKFTPIAGDAIRFGLGALRGLGAGAVASILDHRATGGPYRSLFDLADRVDLKLAGRRSLEAMILAGACDQFTEPPGHRAQLLEGLDVVVREAQLRHEERASGQVSLFDMGSPAEAAERPEPQMPDVPRWTETERLTREKEILGFFISGHPLERYRDEVRVFDQVNTTTLKQFRDKKVELACVVTGVSRQISRKNGSEWGRLTVEDFHGTASVLAFGDVWEQYHDLLLQDAPVLLRGSVSGRDRDEDDPPIFLDSVVPLPLLRTGGTLAIEVMLAPGASADMIGRATELLRASPGAAPVYVTVSHRGQAANGAGVRAEAPNGETAGPAEQNGRTVAGGSMRLRSRSITVMPSEALLNDLRELFGGDRIRLVRS
jgi:DNA polymerase-3 subunit alpha